MERIFSQDGLRQYWATHQNGGRVQKVVSGPERSIRLVLRAVRKKKFFLKIFLLDHHVAFFCRHVSSLSSTKTLKYHGYCSRGQMGSGWRTTAKWKKKRIMKLIRYIQEFNTESKTRHSSTSVGTRGKVRQDPEHPMDQPLMKLIVPGYVGVRCTSGYSVRS